MMAFSIAEANAYLIDYDIDHDIDIAIDIVIEFYFFVCSVPPKTNFINKYDKI